MASSPCVVACYTCSKTVWEGGHITPEGQIAGLPFGDPDQPHEIPAPDDTITGHTGGGQDPLTAYADAHCDRQDCPHTTTTLSAANERDDLLARITALEQRLSARD